MHHLFRTTPRIAGRCAAVVVLSLGEMGWAGGRTGTGGDPTCPTILRQARNLGEALLATRQDLGISLCREVLGSFQSAKGQVNGCYQLLHGTRQEALALVREIIADAECTKRIELWDSETQGQLTAVVDGEERRVLARTQPEPEGAITYDMHRVMRVGARGLFQSLAHELYHKVRWSNRPVDDELARELAFDSAHQLIDTAAEVLLLAAGSRVSDSVLVVDRFVCEVVSAAGVTIFNDIGIRGAPQPSPDVRDPEGYSVGIGLRLDEKTTATEYILEHHGLPRHHFYLRIDEPDPCGPPSSDRRTELGLLARGPSSKVEPTSVARVVIPRSISEECGGESPPSTLSIETGKVQIKCRHSESDTFAPIPSDSY